jgi:hypothetical protein
MASPKTRARRMAGLLAACLAAAGAPAMGGGPQVGVLYECSFGNQLRISRCDEKLCETELGPKGKLAPYLTLSRAGVEDLLRKQACVDPQGRSPVPAAVERPDAVGKKSGTCPAIAPSPPRPGGPRSATLSVSGTGFTYSSTTRDGKTGAVKSSQSSQGNFTNTVFYLLDEDADSILGRAGVEPGILGSRFAMLVFTEGIGGAADDKGIESFAALFGTAQRALVDAWINEPARDARAEFDCAMAAIRAHAVAEMTTDAQARGEFPAVPAGVYYLFGRFHHEGLRGAIWNLRLALPAGRSRVGLSIDNAAWVGARREQQP